MTHDESNSREQRQEELFFIRRPGIQEEVQERMAGASVFVILLKLVQRWRNQPIPSYAFVIGLLICLPSTAFVSADEKDDDDFHPKTNVLLIVTDDAGYADFGCYGGEDIPTPHIDSLARDGVRFTQAYVTASVCCPSRAGLLTGRYQQRFGQEFNGPSKPQPDFSTADMGLDPREVTFGEAFQRIGYRTMAVGKWHMGTASRFHPRFHGFDEFFGFLGGSRSYFAQETGEVSAAHRMYINETAVADSVVTYLTDDLANAATEFINETLPYPWFLYVSFNAVHTPMQAKDADLAEFADVENVKRRTYAAMTKSLDDAVGRILGTLAELQQDRNTLVILINDNGGATNNGSNNGPLRGMKGSKWEGGIRVPLLMRWTGVLPAGETYKRPVSALDLLPTSLAAVEAHVVPQNLDGVNLLPFLRGEKGTAPHDALFWRRGIAAAVRVGPWKLIRIDGHPSALINLVEDLHERTNRLQEEPDRVRNLMDRLAEWERGLSPPKWVEGDRWRNNQRLKHQWKVQTRDQERNLP